MFNIATLREYCEVNEEEVSDVVLTDIESRVVGIVEERLGLYLGEPKEDTIIISGLDYNELFLERLFNEITSIRYRYNLPYGEWQDLDTTYYSLTNGSLLFHRTDAWRSGYEYEITGEIGFESGEEPKIVRQAVLTAIGYILNRKGHEGHKFQRSTTIHTDFDSLENEQFWKELLDSKWNLNSTPL